MHVRLQPDGKKSNEQREAPGSHRRRVPFIMTARRMAAYVHRRPPCTFVQTQCTLCYFHTHLGVLSSPTLLLSPPPLLRSAELCSPSAHAVRRRQGPCDETLRAHKHDKTNTTRCFCVWNIDSPGAQLSWNVQAHVTWFAEFI